MTVTHEVRTAARRRASLRGAAMAAGALIIVLSACSSPLQQPSNDEVPSDAATAETSSESEVPVDLASAKTNADWCAVASTQPAAQRILADEAFIVEPLVDGKNAVNCYFKTETLWLVIGSETPFDESRWNFLTNDTELISNAGVEAYNSSYRPSIVQRTVNGDGLTSVFLMKPISVEDPRAIAAHGDMLELLTWASQNPPPFQS